MMVIQASFGFNTNENGNTLLQYIMNDTILVAYNRIKMKTLKK